MSPWHNLGTLPGGRVAGAVVGRRVVPALRLACAAARASAPMLGVGARKRIWKR